MTADSKYPEMYTNDHGHYVQKNADLSIFEGGYFYICKETLTLIVYMKVDDKRPREFARFPNFAELENIVNRLKYKLEYGS